MFVSRVVQTGLPKFGTLLAHIWPKGDQVDALEDLINLFGTIDLEWSHPPGSNRRPADYESAALPTELGWRAFINLSETPAGSWIQFTLTARSVPGSDFSRLIGRFGRGFFSCLRSRLL